MIPVLGGLSAALLWTGATLCSTRASRLIGASPTLAWVMLLGFAAVMPFVVAGGVPDQLGGSEAAWLLVAGAGNVVGLLLVYTAVRRGKIGVVAPIASTEGAVAAVVSIAAGEEVQAAAIAALAVVVVGVVLSARERDVGGTAPAGDTRVAVFCAIGAALAFGASLYSTGRVSEDLPLVWALVPPRIVGVAVVTLPLALRGRLRVERAAAPFLALTAACEIGGFTCFALGAREGIAVAAVLSSLFAAFSAVGAYLLFGERLARVQIAGVCVIAVGVTALTIATA